MSQHLVQVTTFPDRSEIVNRAFVDYVRRYVITAADFAAAAGGVYRIPVLAGETVLQVRTIVTEAFSATTTITVGDKDAAAGYLASADIGPTTLNSFANSLTAGEALAEGKYYAADNQILVTEANDPSVGTLVLEVVKSGYPSETPSFMIANR